MSKEKTYIAIRPEHDTVEVIGNSEKVMDYLANNFTLEEIKNFIEVYELGARARVVFEIQDMELAA